jgi:adsorption protein B
MLGAIAAERGGLPFDDTSLTEDYELGLSIAERGGRGIFARIEDEDGLIAVKAHFPSTLATAVRQKTRWITGIALAGWDRLGWSGGWAECWMRLRDRRAILAAFVLAAAYAALVLGFVLGTIGLLATAVLSPLSPGLVLLLKLNLALLLWRLAMRAWFSGRTYGRREALRAVPRAFVSNIIAMMAARRALFRYLGARNGTPPRWEKTRHIFPESAAS